MYWGELSSRPVKENLRVWIASCMWTCHFHECRLVSKLGIFHTYVIKTAVLRMAPDTWGKRTKIGSRPFIAVKYNIFPFKSILENVFSYSFWCILCLRLAAVKRELKVKEMHLQEAARRRLLQLQQEQREMELRRLDDEIERKVYYSFLCSHTLSLFTLIWM